MGPKKYLFDVDGVISKVLTLSSAEIEFTLDGKTETALLRKERFFHNGRLILYLPDVPLANYVRKNMQVKFSCHLLESQDATPNPFHSSQGKWYAMMCWAKESSMTEVSICRGLFGVAGTIVEISKRRGVLAVMDENDDEYKVSFHASKVYSNGKKFSGSKGLDTQLYLFNKMYLDAIPCFSEENRQDCQWLAVCAFQGPRPRLPNLFDMSGHDFQANHPASKPNVSGNNKDFNSNDTADQGQQSPSNNASSQLCRTMKMHTHNPRTLFTTGYGFILDIINDEFGIILGCFRKNVFQTILFHRSNASLFKLSLARAKLTEIFLEGDRVKFIAVGAPLHFYTDWIAAQVCVSVDNARDDFEM